MPRRIIHLSYGIFICGFLYVAFSGEFFGDKGSIWSNGNLSYSFISSEYTKTNSFACIPTIRFFPLKSVFIGPRVDWLSHINTYKRRESNKYRDHFWGIGLDFGGLFNNNEPVIPYFSLGYQYDIHYSKSTYTKTIWDPYNGQVVRADTTETYTSKGMAIPTSFGLLIPIKGALAFQIEAGFQVKFGIDQENMNIFSLSLGFAGIGRKNAISTQSNIGRFYF